MAYKVMKFQDEAREKLFQGVKLLADAVVTTLSPKGRNVAIHRNWGAPIIVHDGVTVAREVESLDPSVKIGIDLVREAAQKTNEEAGDGTTTATLLAYEVVKGGLELIKGGTNPMVLRDQIYKALPDVLAELKKQSKPVKTKEEIADVAFISSADRTIGNLVAEAVEKVGEDGMVTCEEGKGLDHEIEYTDGLQFNHGYLSPYFVTNPSRMECVIEDPAFVIIPKKLSMNTEVVPLLEAVAKKTKNIVIIAEEVTGDALTTLAVNKMKGIINVVAVMGWGRGDKMPNYEDMAILTGGRVLSDESGINPTENLDWLGYADKFVASRDESVIIGGKGEKKAIEKRIADLKKIIEEEKSPFEKEKEEERLAKLSTGVAVIRVGAKTEVEMREKMERVKDAIGSATSARDEGIVVGGGSVFLQMAKVLKGENEGEKLLKNVLESPTRKIMSNCGEPLDVINDTIKKLWVDDTGKLGYEVNSGEVIDLLAKGIIDPTKVCRLALENAIGVGTSILTTDCTIAVKFEKQDRKVQQGQ